MDAANPSQQEDWQNNVYIVNTTRILMALGLTFSIRSVYQLCRRMRSAGNASPLAGAEEAGGVDLEALTLGAQEVATMLSLEPVNGINQTIEITLPQPTYSARPGSSQPRALPRQQLHAPEALSNTT